MDEIFTRRSSRSFLAKPIEREKLDKVLIAGQYAPSAINNQDRQFTAVLNSSMLKALNAAVENAVSPNTKKRISDRLNGNFCFFYHAPALIITSHDPSSVAPAADCAVALENMFLEAESLNLGTCWINQLNDLCDEPTVRDILNKVGVNPNHKVYGCCALGYSDAEKKLFKEKQSKIVIYD